MSIPPDERDLAIDDHGLLVMAVKRVFARIRLAADSCPARQRSDCFAHLGTGGVKRGERRSCPDEHSDVDPSGSLGQELAEHSRALAAHQLEIGRDVPTHHVDKFAGALDCLRDRRKGLCTVDEDVEPAAPARRRFAGRPRSHRRRVPARAPRRGDEGGIGACAGPQPRCRYRPPYPAG